MATAFESSLSSSMSRQTMAPVGPSVADTLPSINFGFDDLRDRMAKFTAKFDAFIEQGRKRVLEERNQFRMNLAELHEDQRMKKKDVEIVHAKTSTHQQTIYREDAETREMESAIASLAAQRDQHLATRDSLKAQIAQTQAEIEQRLAAQRAHAQQQEAQSRFNVPELDFWISNLCLKIEGAGQDDRLKFIYTHIDDKNWEREAWFELVTSSRDYDVKHCRPKLEREKVERVLDKMRHTNMVSVTLLLSLVLKHVPRASWDPTKTSPNHHRHYASPQSVRTAMPELDKHAAAQQAVDILHEISTILNCQLDRRTLSICIAMIERGVNPEALAQVIKELRQEGQEVKQQIASRGR
ncbi:putative kinetochore protein SPC25 [Paramyrothecium foliicola]|nr:putative kinetochore protein SPC25 [Paramyrothecium foliicola]